MPKTKKTLNIPLIPLMIAAMVIIIIGLLMIKSYKIKNLPQTGPASTPIPSVIAGVTYRCEDKKSIQATFYEKKVELKLSDGRSLTVPQVISADGARYANVDESFVFWSKGNTAFIQEGQATTYAECVEEPVASTIPKNTVSVVGEILCLPHKNQNGPQTMECAYGLKAQNGVYYGLSDTDPGYKNIMGIPMNSKVEVTGAIDLKADSKYDTIGTISVKSIKQL